LRNWQFHYGGSPVPHKKHPLKREKGRKPRFGKIEFSAFFAGEEYVLLGAQSSATPIVA
jgi:hypothetical protein